jgi:hypothetical protein
MHLESNVGRKEVQETLISNIKYKESYPKEPWRDCIELLMVRSEKIKHFFKGETK